MIKYLYLLITALLLSCGQNIDSQIDDLFENYTGNVPGASLMIIKDGEIIFERSYGLADLENKTAVIPNTNFRLASVSKTFTSMSILQLIEKGDITFKTKLTDIFDGFPEYGNTVTIKHLLQHSSGLIDYENLIPDTATIQVLDKDVLEMMKQVDSTYFTPGSEYKYSNSGFALLAMIVEKISGLSFANYLEKNIFKPIGMNNTVAFENGVSKVNNRAMGYKYEDEKFIFKDQSITSAVLGDGGIYTSITDLYQWDQVLYTNQLISTKTLDKVFSRGELNNSELIDYGFGWRIEDFNGHYCVYHTGGTCGFRNVLFRIPEQKLTVIILTNRAEPDLRSLAEQIVEIFLI